MSKQRIGILTSGGDCPGLNAVIRGAVKASHQLGYDCVGFLKGYEGLYDPVQYVHLTPSSTRGILNQGGTILGSTNKGRFAATVGVQDRQEIEPHLIEGVKQTIEQLGITGLICVGGDGSLAVAQQFHEQGIPVVGVPKTIDNDLSATAFTFGFDSAIECATDALDRLHTTAASHERIMVLEVMGRHAGWIALHSGIAGGGDVILLPEIKWNWDHVCHKILHRESQGKKFTLVVVAEGAHLPGGDLVGKQQEGAQMKLGGVGRAVCDEIERRLHREVRLSVLGHLQRGGKPTTFDRVLATQFGAHAVRLVHERRFGEMICSQPPEMNSVPIMEAVNVLRQVDPHGPGVQAARALGISFGDRPADEIGHNVFDKLAPAAHVPGFVAAERETGEEFTDDFTEELAAPQTEESTPEVEEVAAAETPKVETLSEPTLEAAEAEPETAEEVTAEQAAADEVGSEEEAEQPTAEEVAGLTEEEPAAEPEVEAVADEAPLADELPTESPLVAEADDEDAAAEEIAETLLDMVADADELIHGPAETGEDDADAPETAEADETEAEEAATLEDALEETTNAALELDESAEEEAQAAEEPAPEAPAKPKADLAAAQALLAERIAEAAKAKRDEAPVEVTVEVEAAGLSVADLVKKKLAAAAEAAKAAPAKSPLDEPHGEDLVSDARSALEEALAD